LRRNDIKKTCQSKLAERSTLQSAEVLTVPSLQDAVNKTPKKELTDLVFEIQALITFIKGSKLSNSVKVELETSLKKLRTDARYQTGVMHALEKFKLLEGASEKEKTNISDTCLADLGKHNLVVPDHFLNKFRAHQTQ
jgi:hypothetical protein